MSGYPTKPDKNSLKNSIGWFDAVSTRAEAIKKKIVETREPIEDIRKLTSVTKGDISFSRFDQSFMARMSLAFHQLYGKG